VEEGSAPLGLTLTVELHPSDVVSHTLHLPAGQGRLHHGQVGLATGAGEGCCYVALYPLGVSNAQDLMGTVGMCSR